MTRAPRKSRGPMVVLLSMPLLLALYVLSSGPACRIAQEFPASQSLIAATYAPLWWAMPDSEPVEFAILCYLDLWDMWTDADFEIQLPDDELPPAIQSEPNRPIP